MQLYRILLVLAVTSALVQAGRRNRKKNPSSFSGPFVGNHPTHPPNELPSNGDPVNIANQKCEQKNPVSVPVCSPIFFPPQNGDLDITLAARIECNSGYDLLPNAQRVYDCESSGRHYDWDNDTMSCCLKDCYDPPDVANGDEHFTCTVETCEVTYSCNSGYFLDGVSSRTCQANGQWSGNSPTCPPVDCLDLADPEDGDVDYTCTTYTCTANFTCNDGYTLVGSDHRTCNAFGDWTHDNPTCVFPEGASCAELYNAGVTQSGVYPITVGMATYDVFCDSSDGGGWTVFQRRFDGSVPFNRNWQGYKQGFGDLNTEFWLGNELVSQMTSGGGMTLRLNIMDFNDDTRYAEYTNFKVLPESNKYTLEFGTYSGTAGDTGRGLSFHRNRPFSTIDVDNDGNFGDSCANTWGGGGGWWYGYCSHANLNGFYNAAAVDTNEYIIWDQWKGSEQLKSTEMKFRPSNF